MTLIPDKPSTDMLQRMQMPESKVDSRVALAEEVEDLLGYTPLRKDAGGASKLQRLLFMLDITPFDIATVSAYKTKMRDHFQAKANERYLQNMLPYDWMRSRPEVEWSCTPLSQYDKPVPEFVLRKAVDIKKQAPEAVFFVDHLREQKVDLDPFLWVGLGDKNPNSDGFDEFAAIEVWDEPEFEKSL